MAVSDVVAVSAASIHTDVGHELPACKPVSLIRIDYLRHSVSAHSKLERFNATKRVHRDYDAHTPYPCGCKGSRW